MISGKAYNLFGDDVKVEEFIISKTLKVHSRRKNRMKSHGRRFQSSIGMEELQGINNPNVNIFWGPGEYTKRKIILLQKTSEGKKMFLSVIENWVSESWQSTFLLQLKNEAYDFSSCTGA